MQTGMTGTPQILRESRRMETCTLCNADRDITEMQKWRQIVL